MEAGVAKIVEDEDFLNLKNLINDDEGWATDYDKNFIQVFTKSVDNSIFKMVKIRTIFRDVCANVLYDVLHDPEYRKVWDPHLLECIDIGYLNPNNDVGYYALSCPPPLKNRDFVFQRSWLDTGQEQLIINHSVYHKDYPPRKGYVRAVSHLTGYYITSARNENGCNFSYVSRSDMQGAIPAWLVNKCTQIFAPRYVKQVEKAALSYPRWKNNNSPHLKPWIYPEQLTIPKIRIEDCVPSDVEIVNNPQLKYPRYTKKHVVDILQTELKTPPSEEISEDSKTSELLIVKQPSRTSLHSIHTTITRTKSNENVKKTSSNVKKYISCLNFTKSCTKRSNSHPIVAQEL